jgi:hypothetical protein
MKKFISTTLLLGSVAFCMAMALIDVTGTWKGDLNTPDGNTLNLVYKLKGDGDKLTGTVGSQEGEIAIENGVIKGSEISFTTKRQGEDVKHVGTVYADSIGMNINAQGYDFHVTLKKEGK